jgi:hypothetical protein
MGAKSGKHIARNMYERRKRKDSSTQHPVKLQNKCGAK